MCAIAKLAESLEAMLPTVFVVILQTVEVLVRLSKRVRYTAPQRIIMSRQMALPRIEGSYEMPARSGPRLSFRERKDGRVRKEMSLRISLTVPRALR